MNVTGILPPSSLTATGSVVKSEGKGESGFREILSNAVVPQESEKVKSAAKQFEGLIIGQILKSAHESGGGWMGAGDDQSGATALELAEEQFAQAMASGGGLGLAKLVEKGLGKKPASSPPR